VRVTDDVAGFYDAIADAFHLVHRDWDDSVRRQGEALDLLLARELGAGPKRVLDCACGIGTQAIGLALRGHRVTGTDLSPRELERAGREARAPCAELELRVADLRDLAASVQGGSTPSSRSTTPSRTSRPPSCPPRSPPCAPSAGRAGSCSRACGTTRRSSPSARG
jgi:SAM-dependent methyltransferase